MSSHLSTEIDSEKQLRLKKALIIANQEFAKINLFNRLNKDFNYKIQLLETTASSLEYISNHEINLLIIDLDQFTHKSVNRIVEMIEDHKIPTLFLSSDKSILNLMKNEIIVMYADFLLKNDLNSTFVKKIKKINRADKRSIISILIFKLIKSPRYILQLTKKIWRKSYRHTTKLPVYIRYKDQRIGTSIRNLSTEGAYFESDHELQIGESIDLKFMIKNTPLLIKAEIKRTEKCQNNNKFGHGIEFSFKTKAEKNESIEKIFKLLQDS